MENEGAIRQRMVAALAGLSMAERAVYLLGAADQFSNVEIAFRLGISTREVETHLASALVRIGEALDAQPSD
jgi:DNA-directed RNA polymerase specialized sigma24 family protein